MITPFSFTKLPCLSSSSSLYIRLVILLWYANLYVTKHFSTPSILCIAIKKKKSYTFFFLLSRDNVNTCLSFERMVRESEAWMNIRVSKTALAIFARRRKYKWNKLQGDPFPESNESEAKVENKQNRKRQIDGRRAFELKKGLVSLFHGISTFGGYLMSKPFSSKNSSGTI